MKIKNYSPKDTSSTKLLQVKNWLDEMGVKNYTINDDGIVDVKGDVNLVEKDLYDIPIQFGKVTGEFDCSWNNLKSLKGCPEYVGLNFICSYNDLKSIEGSPEFVGAVHDCIGTKIQFTETEVEKICDVKQCIYTSSEF